MATKVLLVDDEQLILRAFTRRLSGSYEITTADGGIAALDLCRARVGHPEGFDVIVSDIRMPRLSGIDLIREVRKTDLDVPIVLMTGSPDLASAMAAVKLGAFSYLAKPFDFRELEDTIARAAKLHALARVKREALELLHGDTHLLGDRASLEERFASAMASLHVVFQPIVSMSKKGVVAYEALVRTEEPTLKNPLAFVAAAERLKRLADLGEAVRESVARASSSAPPEVELFVNIHPAELVAGPLTEESSPLSGIASRVVLELTERERIDTPDVADRVAALRARGYKIAVDDLGAGYAGLSSLTSLSPDVAKIDMSLVRNIDTDVRRQRIVGSLVSLCRDLSMRVVVEGVETRGERDALVTLGADVMQGYFFAKPALGFAAVGDTVFG